MFEIENVMKLESEQVRRVFATRGERIEVLGEKRTHFQVVIEMLAQRGHCLRIAEVDGERSARAHATAQGRIIRRRGAQTVQGKPK